MVGLGSVGYSGAWQRISYARGTAAPSGEGAIQAPVSTPSAGGTVGFSSPAARQLPGVEALNNASETLARLRIHYPDEKGPALPGESPEGVTGVEDAGESREVGQRECQTCARRKYQDGSNDPGVSFKTPTAMDPDRAASAVRGHEQEHVVRERAEAQREGKRVVSQSVTLHTDICPECGRVYVSGGVTETVTAEDASPRQGGDAAHGFEAAA